MKSLPYLYIFIGLCWGCRISSLQAQHRPGSLRMIYEVGFQEHERRIFRYYEVPPNNLGTYQLALGITKDLLWNETGRFFLGAAYGLEVNTFNRRFDHCALKHYLGEFGECNEMLLYIKQNWYHQHKQRIKRNLNLNLLNL